MRLILAVMAVVACGSVELAEPSPPPVWPMGDASTEDLPSGAAKPPTAPPELAAPERAEPEASDTDADSATSAPEETPAPDGETPTQPPP